MNPKLILIFSILIMPLFLITGCDILESDNYEDIKGKWINDSSVDQSLNLTQRLEYTFNSDSTFQAERIIIDSKNNIVGYRHSSNGFYSVNDNQLFTHITQIYSMDRQPEPLYVSRDELKFYAVNNKGEVKFTIHDNEMTFEPPPCPPNANCIGQVVFTRLINFRR